MMKTMKKTIAIALAFCLAFAGVLSSKGVVANAAAGDNIRVRVEAGATLSGGTVYLARVTGVSSAYITTVKVNKSYVATLGKWERMEKVGGNYDPTLVAEVSVNPAKDTYFAVKSGDTVKYVKLAAASKSKYFPVVSYDEKTGAPLTGVADTKKATKSISSDAEAHGQNAEPLPNKAVYYVNVPGMEDGTTKYLIVKEENASADAIDSNKITLKGTTAKLDVTIIGTADSKVVKVKTAKRAKGPAAAINYVKGEVTIPKGCSYRVVSSDGTSVVIGGTAVYEGSTASYDAEAAASKAYKLDVSKYNGGTVEVIKKAAKKRASKVTAVSFAAAASADGDLKFTSTYVPKTKKVSVTIENASSDAIYEYKNAAGKWVKIPAKSTKTGKNGSATIAGLSSGDAVTVRVQGNKAKQLTAGAEYVAYKAVGPTEFKASCDATPTASGNATGKIKVTFVSGNAIAASLKATGAVVVKIGNKDKKFDITNGVAEITDLAEGSYEVKVVWPADEAKLYAPITAQTVKIEKAS